MCDNNTEELERMIKEQREMIEKLIEAQKASFKETTEPKKERAEDAMKAILSIIANKDIQKHFVKAGMEFLSGIEEIIKAVPFPDSVKEKMDKASEAKDEFVRGVVCELNPVCKQKTGKKMKKIDVE
jgi:vacuolar-type H+-ATPase subunit E/Vma4